MQKKTIVFILPGEDKKTMGGYKVVYEYANHFAADNFDVHIIYPTVLSLPEKLPFLRNVKHQCGNLYKLMIFFIKSIFHCHNGASWFNLRKSIKKDFIFFLSKKIVLKYPDNAIFVATALATSFNLYNVLSKINNGQNRIRNSVYFIQGFEAWGVSKSCVYKSYQLGFRNIVIAPWLLNYIKKVNCSAEIIYNGFDFNFFKLRSSIEKRSKFEIAMLWHKDTCKRCQDSIDALFKVKKKISQLHVNIFGTFDKPDLPAWFTYIENPNQKQHNDIYNKSAIYIAASDVEGFGLTVGEAMICGCAIACTDNGGFTCMVKNNETGVLSPVYDIDKLAENILKLIQNDEYRIRLAKKGNEFIQNFKWDKSYKKFKKIIECKIN